ncbi:MAG TPA: type II toxin-antitoxin system VapC family toxin [Acidimicrobiales bacterium]|jgi:hypothetical protein|nr:type II toxin-antitoxin system VapC family toxin [Acidimicrobiales bacterium]
MLLDVNVVLAAHRGDHPHHPSVRSWFDQLTHGDDAFTVPDTVWASVVRLATSRRIFPVPSGFEDVFEFLRSVRSQPNHVALVPSDRHLSIFEKLCRDAEATGDLAAGAYIAALALEHGCELISLDRDFARFSGLRWRRPGDG